MSRVVVGGRDASGFGERLEEAGATVRRITGPITTSALEEAGIAAADLLVLTDVSEATAIPIARERNGALRIVVLDDASVPDFAAHQADLVLSPGQVDEAIIVDALLSGE